jgi:hypothetical protein
MEPTPARIREERVLVTGDANVLEGGSVGVTIDRERDTLHVLALGAVVGRLAHVGDVVERILDREVLGAEVGCGDAEGEAAARTVSAAAGRRRVGDRVEGDHRPIAALTDEREPRAVDRELLAISAVVNEDDRALGAIHR